ncbi:MAG: hypothetical protein WBY53_15980 [Acidobacteriaceae bacterium]
MSDDTTNSGGWEPTGTTDTRGNETNQQGAPNAPRVGFCQDCGKPLTQETLRAVGTGVFCEPCLTTRVGSTTAAGYTTVPHATMPPQGVPMGAAPGEPSPMLAAVLGFIPGVGAMYNGQFAKGIVHLIIFGLLVSLSENVNSIFGLFVAGWMFYMAFEAYHTAVARRDGLPLPNAFGFNDIGERMGFGKTWGAAGPIRPDVYSTTSAVPNAPPPPAPPNPQPFYTNVNQGPAGTTRDWVGYVPPTQFGANVGAAPSIYAATQAATGAAAASIPGQVQAQATRDAGPGSAAYTETYTGATNPYSGPVAATAVPEVHASRIPTAAFWLIGLGVLILIANLLPDWKVTEQWWPPLFFAGLSVWMFMRRIHSGTRLVCILRGPVILMVLAVMLALHAVNVAVTVALTVSVLLIVFGALLLLERTAGAIPVYTPPMNAYPGAAATVIPPVESSPNRAAWAEPGVDVPRNDPDPPKAGE